MASVHYGRLLGPIGFSRTVAIKRLHPHYARNAEFVAMFIDEARLAARIRHPNVVPTLDVVATHGELFLVMEYVQGETLSRLLRATATGGQRIPAPIVATIMCGALDGLHAAHEAVDERGMPLNIVHRDVSPQNILVGADGIPRVLDFGVAKAAGRVQSTQLGQLKGKLAYMPPEQLQGVVSRQTDVYAAAIVLWESFTGQRLFGGNSEAEILGKMMAGAITPPSQLAPELPRGVDAIVLRGLARDPRERWPTALEFAHALERACPLASARDVGAFCGANAHAAIAERAQRIAEIESSSSSLPYAIESSVATPAPETRAPPRPATSTGAPSAVRMLLP